MRITSRGSVIEALFPGLHASPGCIFEAVQVILVQVSGLGVNGVLGVELVKAFTSIQQNLPDVVDISPPFVKTTPHIQLVGLGVHQWMKHRVLED